MVIERGFEADYFLRFCGTYFWSRCNARACFLVPTNVTKFRRTFTSKAPRDWSFSDPLICRSRPSSSGFLLARARPERSSPFYPLRLRLRRPAAIRSRARQDRTTPRWRVGVVRSAATVNTHRASDVSATDFPTVSSSHL
jgi:hypothetical protein